MKKMLHLSLTLINKISVFLKVMEFAEKDKILVMQIPFYRLFLFLFLSFFLFFFNLLNEETLRYAILREQTVFIN